MNKLMPTETWSTCSTTTIAASSYLRGRIGWQGLKASEFLDEGPYLVTGTDFHAGHVNWDTCYHVSEARFAEAEYIHLRDGDLLITKDGTLGKIAYVENCPLKAVLNSGVFLLRCRDGSYNHRYMYFVLQSDLFRRFLEDNLAGSTINHLYQYIFKRFTFATPAPGEQAGIAKVLTTIDRTIEQTEALIAKQQRIKTGLMQDLLTRGIDENGNLRSEQTHAFKDSALGRIPVDWEVCPLSSIAAISSGVTLGGSLNGASFVELPYLCVANVQDGFLDLRDIKIVRVHRASVSKYTLQHGDVLMNEGGDFDKLGRGAVWRGEIAGCLHQNHVFKVRPQKGVLGSEFLAAVSASPYGKVFFLLASKQSTNLASINATQLRAFPIPRPDYPEQLRIEEALRLHRGHHQLILDQLRKLQSLRTALMHDLLTGKRRVTALLAETETATA